MIDEERVLFAKSTEPSVDIAQVAVCRHALFGTDQPVKGLGGFVERVVLGIRPSNVGKCRRLG